MSAPRITVALDAVIVAVSDRTPRVLTVIDGDPPAIPSGPLDPAGDATLELALRRYVREQAGLEVGYVEQLYTFGDLRRGSAVAPAARAISVAYLALVEQAQPAPGAAWANWYDILPWEDHRSGRPSVIEDALVPRLRQWCEADDHLSGERTARVGLNFGLEKTPWDGIRVLERYELLYEAGIVAEAHIDGGGPDPAPVPGTTMAADHRRIVATALGRLRGKLTYRPVVFELLPGTFTLSRLQRTVEALAGVPLHTQNFRRLVERAGLVEGTGTQTSTGGRPAELFRFREDVQLERPRPGLGIPYR